MKRRQFTDRDGLAWDVYLIVIAPGPNIMNPALSHQSQRVKTYLAFDSATERRRLTPVPIDWDAAPVEELQRLLASAATVTRVVRREE